MSRLRAALAATALAVLAGAARGECAFDEGYFNRDTYAGKPGVETVVWLADAKEAKIITSERDLVSVKHWACDALGLEARMLVDPDPADDETLKHKLMELARMVLGEAELAGFTSTVGAGANLSGAKVDIPGADNMPEFYYIVQRLDGFDVITLKYYYN
jgi:hypothetical protein